MKDVRIILGYLKPFKKYLSIILFFNILQTIFSLFSLSMIIPFLRILFNKDNIVYSLPESFTNPTAIADTFNYFISYFIINHGKENALLFICFLVLILFFLKNLSRYSSIFFLVIIRNRIIENTRNKIYKKIIALPLSYFNKKKMADIISRSTNDVQDLEWSALRSAEMFLRDPILIIAILTVLFIINPTLTIITLLLIPLSGILTSRITKILKQKSIIGQKRQSGLLAHIENSLSGLRIIKAFNAIDTAINDFKSRNKSYTRLMTSITRRKYVATPLTEAISAIILVIIIWLGGRSVLSTNEMQPEVFIAFIIFFSQLINPAKSINTAIFNLKKGIASHERITELLNSKEENIEQNQLSIKKIDFENEIIFKDVCFSYNINPVLKNINLKIKKGKKIAIVGQSGSGKTTIANLLPRFYDINSGDISIDGISLNMINLNTLRSLFGLIPQEAILFNDTVYNNIVFGKEGVKKEDIIQAAKTANAHDFINDLEDGYQTIISDRGSKLSGGQRQRISIARAILHNPNILIMDEATSALDSESEKLVQQAINKVMNDRTAIIIAHRLSTIQSADEIIVLKNGIIVEKGTHDELLLQKGEYNKLHSLQNLN